MLFRQYTYVDTEGDVNLESFALQEEDLVDKVGLQLKNPYFFFHFNLLNLLPDSFNQNC